MTFMRRMDADLAELDGFVNCRHEVIRLNCDGVTPDAVAKMSASGLQRPFTKPKHYE